MSFEINTDSHSLRLYNTDVPELEYYLIEHIHKQYMKDPMSLLEVSKEDAEHLTERLTSFLAGYINKSGLKGYVIGLSGGIDSAVSAALAVRAVGKENVYGMLLPSKFTAQNHIDDALEVAHMLGIEVNDYKNVRKYFDKAVGLTMKMTGADNISKEAYNLILGNNHARERMKILRGKAQEKGYLVLGTTNMTEDWLGYATIAGDGYKGVDIEPIKMLPKTSERMYARFLGIPEQVITKAPTAGLWAGQTDEKEIGMSYEDIDRVMAGYFLSRRVLEDSEGPRISGQGKFEMLHDKDKNPNKWVSYRTISVEDIVRANNKESITAQSVESIIARAKRNAFKSKPEPYAILARKWYLDMACDKKSRIVKSITLRERGK